MTNPTKTNYHERVFTSIASFLPEARDLVKDFGWKTYPALFEELRTSGVIGEKPVMTMMGGTCHAILEHLTNNLPHPYSYTELVTVNELQDFSRWMAGLLSSGGAPIEVGKGQAHTNVVQAWQQVCLERAGRHIYEISPGLADKLNHTELKGLRTDDLRMPYPSIYIEVPSRLNFQVWNEQTGFHHVEGMFLTEDPVSPYGHGGRMWRILLIGASKNPDNPFDDALFHFNVDLPPEMKLDEALALEQSRIVDVEQNRMELEAYDFYVKSWRATFRWVMNVILYATWPNAEVDHVMLNKEARQLWDRIQKLPKNSKKRDDLRQRMKEAGDPHRRIYLGRSVTMQSVEQARAEIKARTGKELTELHQVEGHWKMQPYGPENSLRKRIFIEPYWRGPEDAPVMARPHKLVE